MDNEKDTVWANDFASDIHNNRSDVQVNWWEFFSNYRLKKWRQELKRLSEKTGVSFEYVCNYIGVDAVKTPGFYRRLPKSRNTYIAIGMAYKLPLETINTWLNKYGMKKKLYIKDILEDLVWVYLINVNFNDRSGGINYYEQYEQCKSDIEAIYLQVWDEIISHDTDTVSLEASIRHICYDSDHIKLMDFVGKNIDAFKTAYAKPRRFLNNYISRILRTKNEHKNGGRAFSLNSLRGYLDDSMINYLSGSYETINVKSGGQGQRTSNIKHIPKNKKAHISICLALGMSRDHIDTYLEMMGYSTLDSINSDEGELINMLKKWENRHPIQRKYKDKYFNGKEELQLSKADEIRAVEEMLLLRQDLKEEYEASQSKYDKYGNINKNFKKFPYMND